MVLLTDMPRQKAVPIDETLSVMDKEEIRLQKQRASNKASQQRAKIRKAEKAEQERRAAEKIPPATGQAAGAPTPGAPAALALAVQNIRRWRKEPWTFVKEVFGVDPDDWQEECLRALVAGGYDKFCLKACKGPGKSCLLAWVIWWFLVCFTHPKILCTSITGENLRDGLWTELAKWRNKSKMLTDLYEWQSDRVYAKAHKETWYASARTWPKDADKTKQANTLAGQHAQHTMVVVDEAGDIPEGVVAAGLAHHSTNDPKLKEVHITLMAGNPTALDGALGIACTRDRAKWWVKEITGDPDDPKRAKRIDLKWAREEIEKWGRDHDFTRVNVFGMFPRVQGNKLLGPDQVRRAMDAVFPEGSWDREPRIMAVDVARSLAADRSVLTRRQGPIVFPQKAWRIADLMELASQVAWEFSQWPAQVIFVDMTGLGAGLHDRLTQLGLPSVGINFGSTPRDAQRFADKRTEMWWDMHMAVKGSGERAGVALPDDSELLAELIAPTISFNERSRLKLESKEKMKARGLSSPDKGDSLVMTWAEPVFAEVTLPGYTRNALNGSGQSQDYDPYLDRESQGV
jgi:hypothetical protein